MYRHEEGASGVLTRLGKKQVSHPAFLLLQHPTLHNKWDNDTTNPELERIDG